tara:strand:+ start:8297 stop:8530 length:234 start_codon:yes stop_codon:yes gene_type:complete
MSLFNSRTPAQQAAFDLANAERNMLTFAKNSRDTLRAGRQVLSGGDGILDIERIEPKLIERLIEENYTKLGSLNELI